VVAAAQPDGVEDVEQVLFKAFLTIRGSQLAVGGLTSAAFWRSYRRRGPLVAALVGLGVEYGWLLSRSRAGHPLGASESAVDLATCLAALLFASPSVPDDVSDLNWVYPLTVSGGLPSAMAAGPRGPRLAPALALASAYLAVLPARKERGLHRAARGASLAGWYLAFAVVAQMIAETVRRYGREAASARAEAVQKGERLAAAREREVHRRLLHDRALQTLEIVAREWPVDPEETRRFVRREAAALRRALRDTEQPSGTLVDRLSEVATDLEGLGLAVELVTAGEDLELAPVAVEALADAVREALTNVLKHSGTRTAVLWVGEGATGVLVTVRDQGCGFDPAGTPHGFGIGHSIIGRLAEIGGDAQVSSVPGNGTRVSLEVPRRS
jgi:signal transduction histidine kinase